MFTSEICLATAPLDSNMAHLPHLQGSTRKINMYQHVFKNYGI